MKQEEEKAVQSVLKKATVVHSLWGTPVEICKTPSELSAWEEGSTYLVHAPHKCLLG